MFLAVLYETYPRYRINGRVIVLSLTAYNMFLDLTYRERTLL